MPGVAGADDARIAFQDALIRALTDGQPSPRRSSLGAQTRAVIDAVAQDHPDATVRLIYDAYDCFHREGAPQPQHTNARHAAGESRRV